MNDQARLSGGETSMIYHWRSSFGDKPASVFITGCQSYKLDGIVKDAANRLLVKRELKHSDWGRFLLMGQCPIIWQNQCGILKTNMTFSKTM